MADILSKYKGKGFRELPTPCFVVQESKFDSNCTNMLNNVHDLSLATDRQILFRAHVKTHKTAQGTFKQLGHGLSSVKRTVHSILISTIKEAQGLLDYQESIGKNYIKDICYSLPACVPEKLEQLSNLSKRTGSLRLFVDNVEHFANLADFGKPAGSAKWSVFIKIDMGTHRAGLLNGTEEFESLLRKAISPEILEVVDLYGFYAHAGHSYSVEGITDAHKLLIEEIGAVNEAAKHLSLIKPNFDLSKLVLSVGATPTSNSLRMAKEPVLVDLVKKQLLGILEIHCGNYCMYDMQQLCTGCIQESEVSGFVLGTICSCYSTRNEILTDTGVTSLTREESRLPGRGLCVDLNEILTDKPFKRKWYVDRVSQEHGILRPYHSGVEIGQIKLGSKIAILPQHACIVMNQFPYYFVVDKEGIIVDVWTPFQKW